jgi:hypothetical protein
VEVSIVENWSGAFSGELFLQINPGAAARIRWLFNEICDLSRTEHSDWQYEESRLPVGKARVRAFIRPDVHVAHFQDGGHIVNMVDPIDLGEMLQTDNSLRWPLLFYFFEHRAGIRSDTVLLLMQVGWVKPEAPMLQAELSFGFSDTALAQQNGLPALAKRSADYGPFLKSMSQHVEPPFNIREIVRDPDSICDPIENRAG